MTDVLRLAAQVGRRTWPTLAQLSADDIDCIWADLSAYIERQMTSQKGVHLAGLGTFTFSQQQLNMGKRTLVQRPIFLLAGKLSQSLGLKQTRPLATATHLPVVQLNFAAVSQESPFSRDVVEGCIRETLQLLFRALASEQNVFITFQGIGVLSFTNNKVRMKFNRDFISAMDGTGRMLLAFNNRPGSSVSLLSVGASRPQRAQTAVGSPQTDNQGFCLVLAPHHRNAGDEQRESKRHRLLQPDKVEAGELDPDPPVEAAGELDPDPPVEAADEKPCSVSPPEVSPNLEPASVPVCCSGHARAGQELCYLCMQRAQRNVPVYRREQQQEQEKAQEKLLVMKQQQRDKEYMEEERAKISEQHARAKMVATFNMKTSEQRDSSSCVHHPTSFIFPARPLTPSRKIQQQQYMTELQSQIERRRQHEAQEKHNSVVLGRLDQVDLVQEIALQKSQQLQQKHERTKSYKKALDTQVGDKKHTAPVEVQCDSAGFNHYETVGRDADKRERAHKLLTLNVSAATRRKTEELHSRQKQLGREREMLKHTKMELILDHISHFEKKRNIIKSLEDEWSRSVRLKRQREEEERRFLRSAGHLLVDKLAQYRRCSQCKRRTSNCGESNVWKDSHYLSGSQFMI